MKTDRELLELAARAADISVVWGELAGCFFLSEGSLQPWDPLRRDGDALRLAVKLKLNFTTGELACAASWPPHTAWVNEVIEAHEGSRQATTRRAIVRAAAAIGEHMQ